MAETGGKKGKKKKGKTLNLNEFLANDTQKSSAVSHAASMYSNRSTSWADESEDLSTQAEVSWPGDFSNQAETKLRAARDRAALPTAPRAARGPDVDMSKLPKEPPFTAFLGNLSYDVDKEDIFEFFNGIKVTEVRLPHDQGGGRPKGFGYAEFEDLQSLMSALELNNEQLKNRRVRVDVAGHQQQGDREGGERMGREGRDAGPDRTVGDWRSASESASPFEQSAPPGRFDDQNGDQGYNRDRGFDRDRGYDRDRRYDRDGGMDRDRGYGSGRYGGGRDQGYRDDRRGYGSGWGGGRYDDRGPRDHFGDEGRGGDRYGDSGRGGDRYGDSGRGGDRYGDSYDRDRGYGGRFGDRDRRDDYGSRGGGGRDRGGYGGGGFESTDSWRGGETADPPRPAQSPPGDDYRNGPPRDSRDYGRMEREPPRERPKLNLKPRSKPAGEEEQKQATTNSSIFGNAKPVDTTAREKEMEERIAREKAEVERKLQREREERERGREGWGSRSRRDSNRSSDGERGPVRDRHDSSGSGAGHGRRERSGSARSSGDERHKEPVPPSPHKGTPNKEPTSPAAAKMSPKEPPKEAPLPVENVWAKRMEAQKSGGPKQEGGDADDKPTNVVASPTRTSAVEKDKRDLVPPSSAVSRGYGKTAPVKREGRENVPKGRGRGRGERPPNYDGPGRDRANEKREPEKRKEKKEWKPREPKMYEETKQPVFHKQSKFSALLDDEGSEEEEEPTRVTEEQQEN